MTENLWQKFTKPSSNFEPHSKLSEPFTLSNTVTVPYGIQRTKYAHQILITGSSYGNMASPRYFLYINQSMS